MTNINIFFNQDKKYIMGFEAMGHSGYANSGEDIVCSAISVLTQTAIQGLVEVAKVNPRYQITEAKAFCTIKSDLTGVQNIQAQAILRTMYIGLKQIEQSYGDYINIIEKRRCHSCLS